MSHGRLPIVFLAGFMGLLSGCLTSGGDPEPAWSGVKTHAAAGSSGLPTSGDFLPEGSHRSAWPAWTGRWSSDRLGFVQGAIRCRFPDPIPVGERFVVPFVVESGLFVLTTGKPRLERTFVCATQREENGRVRITLSATGAFGIADQSVAYVAFYQPGDASVKGVYASVNPEDRGRFELVRVVD